MRSFCNEWEFSPEWSEDFAGGQTPAEQVRLPHTVKEVPLHSIDSNAYQMVCGYRKLLPWEEGFRGKRVFLQFDGAGHIATVYANGKELATHRCGYTAFRVELTQAIIPGEPTLVAVKLDTTENPEVPPFGFVIDYLTFGGLYREAWLDIREQSMIEDVYLTTPNLTTLRLEITAQTQEDCSFRIELEDADGNRVAEKTAGASKEPIVLEYPQAKPWNLASPYRYTCRVALLDKAGKVLDVWQEKFGFRTAEFKVDGFYLNGEKTFLRGLNRHQSYPYIGYAAPERLQREEARILKEELGCTVVRTSHYPQSKYFIDECDRLGLLVFTEIPGWQHIGGESWKDQAVENTREMVLQYRNHPSVILWGVRINESQDNDGLYLRTNETARKLDPSRATTGVRCIVMSSLLEDVYGYNDFSHEGSNPGVRPKKKVTPDVNKPLLVTEHSGHIFPTKSFDTWEKRQEHALRHARVQNDAAADGEHVGCIGWCMFDYATHKDFGSGDRICYHGVLDSFRNPKLAAYTYASQQEERPVLEVGSAMDIGDYPGGILGDVYVFTNAEKVKLYKNDNFVTELPASQWKALPHGPRQVDDIVGDLLETQEHFPKEKAELLRKCLLAAGKRGIEGMGLADKLRMGRALSRYKMTMADGVALYGKYIGNWGGESTQWRFDAIRDGKVVATRTCSPSAKLHLEVTPSHTLLTEGDTYDMAAVRIRILDEFGTAAPYAQLPLKMTLEGQAQLAGPRIVTAEGGMCGTYLRTVGKTGTAVLTVSAPGLEPVKVEFTIK